MSSERIEGLRTTRFPTERRGGYDRAAVDSYLTDLADWLETDEAKAALAQREIERVGERTGAILGAAQESAGRITTEAGSEAEARLAEADREISEQRAGADFYAKETRSAAETDARKIRKSAEEDATKTRAEADEHAKLTIREADDRLERAAREAEERTAGIEDEIAGLAAKRDKLVANLEALAAGVSKVVEGPGSEDLGLPERSRTAAAFTEPVAHPEVADAAPIEVEETVEEEPPTAVEKVAEFDTDEELYEDERPPDPVPSGRDPDHRRPRQVRDPDDPTTEDQKLTELL